MHNLRYAFRQIVRFPGYTATVVLTLALGIAVNTQIFSLVSAVFLQPMPVRDASRLTVIAERSDLLNLPHQMSFADFEDIRAGSKALVDHIAFFFNPADLSLPGKPAERSWIEAVTPDAFAKYGVHAILGRTLQPTDGERPPGVPVTVITHRLWQSRFASDPAVVGRTILINGKPFTIVGVLQPDFGSFSYSISCSLFIPSGALTQVRPDGDAFFKYRSATAWRVLAYRTPHASLAAANAELAVFASRFAKDFPTDHHHSRFQAVPERQARPDPSLSDFMPVFIALFAGLVVLVLLIACANVANLMGAHALNRSRELVVRAALGATRARLIWQLIVESLVLAVLAGIVGYFFTVSAGGVLRQFIPKGDIPIRIPPASDALTLVFTAAISLLAGLVAGILPALRSSRIDLNESLKQGASRSVSGGRHRLRNLLVIGQVAVSCVVLISAALFLRGLHAAADLNFGFQPQRLLLASVDVSLQGYDQTRGQHFEKQLLDDVRALPGVESATCTQYVPFSNNINIRSVFPENSRAPLQDGQLQIAFSSVDSSYLHVMGTPLRRGRDLAATDDARGAPVAVINEAMAKALWPGRDPLGQHFHLDWAGGPAIEVVGLVPTGKYVMLTEQPRPFFYTPFAQRYATPMTLVVRAAVAPATLVKSVHDAVARLDPNLPVYDLMTFDDELANSVMALMPLRMGATLASIQGGLALLLAILGLYSVVSYGVTLRTREIGVRVALGATSQNVLQLVSREGLRLTLIGLGVGLGLAAAVSFGLSRVLFGVHAFDPVAFPAVAVALLVTATLACWLPARRATKVDPMVALRTE
ncbi:MAG TPA: ABC transporter permease [Lacunisphaera sp.]|jgi:predicted permease